MADVHRVLVFRVPVASFFPNEKYKKRVVAGYEKESNFTTRGSSKN